MWVLSMRGGGVDVNGARARVRNEVWSCGGKRTWPGLV